MEELLEILNEIDDSIDYENETALIEMMPVNFNSAKAIWAMVQRLQED